MCRQNCLYGFPLIHCLAVAGGQGSMQKSQGKKKNARICILTFSLMASWRPQADLNRR